MPEVKKRRFYRLFKVAKELNVGSDTIVTYLQDKGHDISNGPNTKLSADQYEILLKEYASEKQLKEKAEQFIERRKEESTSRTIKPRDGKSGSPEKEEDPISAQQLRNKIMPKRKRGGDMDKESTTSSAPPIKQATQESKPSAQTEDKSPSGKDVNTPPSQSAEPSLKAEPASDKGTDRKETDIPEEQQNKPQLKVVGKIDLDTYNKGKSKPDKEEQKDSKTASSEPAIESKQPDESAPTLEAKSSTPKSDETTVSSAQKAAPTDTEQPTAQPSVNDKETKVEENKENASKAETPRQAEVQSKQDTQTQPNTKKDIEAQPQTKTEKRDTLQTDKVGSKSKDQTTTSQTEPSNRTVEERSKQQPIERLDKETKQVDAKADRTDKSERSSQSGDRRRDRDRGDRERNDRDRGDRERNDRDRGDRERNDRDRGDRERNDRDRGNRERNDRDRGNRERNDRDRGNRERRKEEDRPGSKSVSSTNEKAPNKSDKLPKEQPNGEENTEEEDGEIIRAGDHTPKLSGLKVMGKIDLGGGKKSKSKSKSKSTKGKDKDRDRPKDRSRTKEEEDTAKKDAKTVNKKSSDSQQQGEEDDDKKKKRRRRRKRKRRSTVATETNAKESTNDKQSKTSKGKKEKPSKKEVDESIRQTLSQMSQGPSRTRQRLRRAKRDAEAQKREKLLEQQKQESKVLEVTEFITANEFANLIEVPVNDIIKKSFELGMMVSINQRLDAELISIIAEEYGYDAKFIDVTEQEIDETEIEEDDPADLKPRNPIITVMGHVDHGKTTLLDHLRNTNVTAKEAGGITQHIGAYQVKLSSGERVTFLDTPGHEAFTAMRARGAKATDVAIIVIAADDAVMPQTREAINHAQAADVPMIFAINKVDKPNADPDKIKNQLAEMNILVEDWGGKYQSQEISALKGQGVEDLLEKVILEAELLELKANPDRGSAGTVIEARLDKGLGNVATLLVQNGTLNVGDEMVVGVHYAKVRALIDQNGKRIKKAGPSVPVQVLGLSGQPQAGDKFIVFKEESKAKEIAQRRQELYREQQLRQTKRITLEEIGRRRAIGNFKELNVIIRADVDGSVEALSGSLLKLSTEEVQVNILLKGVGAITEGDVLLSSASDAVIIAFNVRPTAKARQLAEKEEIDIRTYSVIYDAINDVTDALEGLLSPEIREEIMGTAEVREVFKISKVGAVAGCYATNGKIFRNEPIRVIRDGVVIYDSTLASLKRFKDDVKEVSAGFEFGAMVENYNDIKEGDILESYKRNEVRRKLKK